MRYTVEITIRDNLLNDTVFIERNSDEPTWMWMANTMFDALRGASFVLPDNIDFPSISEIVEEWVEEYAQSDGEGGAGWIPHDPKTQGQPVADDVEVEVEHRSGDTSRSLAGDYSNLWGEHPKLPDYHNDIVAWRYAKTDAADENIGYGGTD